MSSHEPGDISLESGKVPRRRRRTSALTAEAYGKRGYSPAAAVARWREFELCDQSFAGIAQRNSWLGKFFLLIFVY